MSKVSKTDIQKLARLKNGVLITNSVTIIGKYISGKGKEIKYLACDGNFKRASLKKADVINKYNSGISFSNIKVSIDGKIRMLSGSIPFLGKLQHDILSKNTVVKLNNIAVGTASSLGVGKKFFGRRIKDGALGCVKFPLVSGSYDIDNEVLAYEISKLLKFDVAEATTEIYNNTKCVISIYNYKYNIEAIKSLKSEIGTVNFHSKFNKNWFIKEKSSSAWNKFMQMIILDLIMHQVDRHISNIAFKGKDLYSLYDNGRSLFFYDFYNEISKIDLSNRGSIVNSFYTNEHGYGWMYLEDVLGYNGYKHLIPLDLKYSDFKLAVYKCYGNRDEFRNLWVTEYMYKVYLIITRQEKRWEDRA